ncbi:hypothetical protein M9H77_03144 [Catharanthus roseus]|uniref:Uncharacterized protein n=1 Tax=Catharanthus roseus TaxID=4058 RepID=A0ACC0CAF9_CATRO|nr:hypothetical protein M9H77_03144 [Catharanthus roseus]
MCRFLVVDGKLSQPNDLTSYLKGNVEKKSITVVSDPMLGCPVYFSVALLSEECLWASLNVCLPVYNMSASTPKLDTDKFDGTAVYDSPFTGIHETNSSTSDRDASPFCVLKTIQN